MGTKLIVRIAGVAVFALGAGLMVTRHPILVALMVIGAVAYYVADRIL